MLNFEHAFGFYFEWFTNQKIYLCCRFSMLNNSVFIK